MRSKSLLSAVLSGLALPASVYSTHTFPRLTGSDLDRLRGDVERVGSSFKTVIVRENGKKTASTAAGRSSS